MTAEQPLPAGENGPGANGDGPADRPTHDAVFEALSQVYDPEIGIDIVSLGLVYDADLDDEGMLTVDMTLTSPYCPMGSIIQTQVHAVATQLPGVKDARVNLVWSPPWDPRVMASDEAKLELGIY
jgi:metal-sulfur cluster biosynthetic enzyme